jgi:cysteine synthase A
MGSVAGRIGNGTRIVESTSGNLGVALAGMCRELGIPFTAVVDSRLPRAMANRHKEFGARISEVERRDDSLHLQRRLARVREIVRNESDTVWTNQYENPANVSVHRWWTGPELSSQVGGTLQALFAPVSTGGSFVGLRDYMRAERPKVRCVAVDVTGSTIFGGTPRHRLLTGIGASKPSVFIGESDLPPHVMVSDAEAMATCRTLSRDLGISVGGSSGAAISGCLKYLSERPYLTVAACMCPDMGTNYQETLYSDFAER